MDLGISVFEGTGHRRSRGGLITSSAHVGGVKGRCGTCRAACGDAVGTRGGTWEGGEAEIRDFAKSAMTLASPCFRAFGGTRWAPARKPSGGFPHNCEAEAMGQRDQDFQK